MVERREQLIEIMKDAAKGETKASLRAEVAALERQLAEARAEYLSASKDAMELAGKLNAAEAERDRLAADNARLESEALTLERALYWFIKYPEYIPAPEFMNEVFSDIQAARPLVPASRTALAGKE